MQHEYKHEYVIIVTKLSQRLLMNECQSECIYQKTGHVPGVQAPNPMCVAREASNLTEAGDSTSHDTNAAEAAGVGRLGQCRERRKQGKKIGLIDSMIGLTNAMDQ